MPNKSGEENDGRIIKNDRKGEADKRVAEREHVFKDIEFSIKNIGSASVLDSIFFILYSSFMIDSHAHVADDKFSADRERVAERARAVGVRWIEIGTSVEESERALALATQLPESILGATVGVQVNIGSLTLFAAQKDCSAGRSQNPSTNGHP